MVDFPPDHVPLKAGQSPAMNPQRLAKAMHRWRRRSRVIHFWRRALPLLMVLIAAGVLTQVVIREVFGVHGPSARDQDIRMLGPKFFGRDQSGRPYTVTAIDAVRDPVHPERVALNQPHMVLQQLNGDPPTIVYSATGLYNETTHMLALDGQVHLDDGKGDIFISEHALVNTDAGTVDGRSPVTGTGPMGTTSSTSYFVKDKGKDILFIGNVKSHILSNTPPPAPKPVVAAP
jgi:lipopolysaccharide export system protein LptC